MKDELHPDHFPLELSIYRLVLSLFNRYNSHYGLICYTSKHQPLLSTICRDFLLPSQVRILTFNFESHQANLYFLLYFSAYFVPLCLNKSTFIWCSINPSLLQIFSLIVFLLPVPPHIHNGERDLHDSRQNIILFFFSPAI